MIDIVLGIASTIFLFGFSFALIGCCLNHKKALLLSIPIMIAIVVWTMLWAEIVNP